MNNKRKPPPKHHSHLTFEDRVRIDEMLRRGDSFRSIAAVLGKTPSTISREIRNHTTVVPTRETDCIYLRECTKTKLCEKPGCNTKKCKTCTVPCKKHCTDYVQSVCEKLMDSPYVCNGCKRMYSCKLEHHIYNPKDAQKEYRSMLTDSLPVSEATLRRMITNRELDVRNVDLRNVVSRKPRRKTNHKLHNETLSRLKIGHTYKDYLAYIAEHDVTAVQMDCVEGTKEDTAVLLTLHFPAFHMQLAYIMNEHTTAGVVHTLDMLEEALGTELFKQVFPVILTDNGHEFMDIADMERSINGGQRTKIFFCEPNRSDEKGACENNHKLIRYVIPKGTSLEPFGQVDINLMMNHINSYSRKALYGKTPYDVAMKILPEDFFILLGLEQFPPMEVVLKPSLFPKKAVYLSK